ncbi:MAG: DUF4249 family protein [Candidatus Cryptobacteroides sp.]
MTVNNKPTVVAECILTDKPVQTLRLSFTTPDGSEAAVQEAKATLTDLTEERVAGYFTEDTEGLWTLDYKAVYGHKYKLEIEVPGYELITAEETMPIKCNIKSVWGALYSSPDNIHPLSYGSVFESPMDNYIMWVYAMNYNIQAGKREIVERICTDAGRVDNFNITGDNYDPPHSDLDIFGQVRDSYLYWELEGYPLHNKYLRLEMEPGEFSESNYVFSVAGSFEGDYFHNGVTAKPSERPPRNDEGVVVATIVSDKYDRFLRDVIYFMHLAESTELSSIYVRDNLYTNINGGLGIFGAKSEKYLEWVPAYTQKSPR